VSYLFISRFFNQNSVSFCKQYKSNQYNYETFLLFHKQGSEKL
jgi:hypothetical protein